jgi:hypothetical protein
MHQCHEQALQYAYDEAQQQASQQMQPLSQNFVCIAWACIQPHLCKISARLAQPHPH